VPAVKKAFPGQKTAVAVQKCGLLQACPAPGRNCPLTGEKVP